MKVILCNDDIGLTYGFTEAIKDTFLKGNSSSTSIRTNGIAYNYAVKLLKTKIKSIGLGLHVNLVDGKAHISKLANSSGDYKFNFLQYLLKSGDKSFLNDVEGEIDYQFKKVINDGLKIDHVSAHRHTYIIPAIFEIICRLCKKYNVKSIRLLQEPFYTTESVLKNISPFINSNIIKFWLANFFNKKNKSILKKYQLKTTEAFYGVLYTDAMDFQTIKSALDNAQKRGYKTIEILIHPAYANDPRDKIYTSKLVNKYIHSKARRTETSAALSKKIKNLLSSPIIKLSSFRDLN